MVQILIAHADGEEALATEIAEPLEAAGYEVLHHGTLLVGEGLVEKASQAISAGSPVVLCGTVKAAGTRWAALLVAAARRQGGRIFALQVERDAYLEPLALDGKIAPYWQDRHGAMAELVEALSEFYPARKQTGTGRKLNHLEQRYRELALETCDIVDLANFPIGDRELITRNLLLRSLYVSLRVSVDIPPSIDPQDLDKKLQNIEARRKHQDDLHQDELHQDDLPDAGSRVSVGERLQASNHLVVLGDPGAGKSTLLRWIATAYLLRLQSDPDWSQLPDVDTLPDTDWLPLFIRCRDLDTRRITGSLEEMIRHHLCDSELSRQEADQLTPLLLDFLRDGRVLLLIDGLDEITDPALRARFCRKVEKIHVAFPKAPVIVTSRIVGYREMGLRITRGFEHVTVQDLTPSDKDDFARRWCVVTEPPNRRDSAAEELISDIHSTDRIERLTGNPMLLTTMALVKKKVGKLPSRRADLYREAVDVLLNWRSDVDERMDPHEALPQLQYLAYSMCEAGVQQIRQDEVLGTLERMREEFPAVHAVRRRSPVDFLRRLERQTGILVESGHISHHGRLVPLYEFRHLTFQEYLAGLALVDGKYPGRDRSKSLAEQIATLTAQTSTFATMMDQEDIAVAENWREAIRLSVMTCNDDDVDGVLRAISTPLAGEDASATARPRAVLACACLADEPNVSGEVAAEIIERFVAALTDSDGTGPAGTTADTVLEEVGISRWAALLSRSIVTSWLEEPSAVDRLAGAASQALGQTTPTADADVRSWVRNQVGLLKEPRAEVAIEAALALMDAGYRQRLVMVPGLARGLISMLSRGPCEATAAAWALGWTRKSSHKPLWEPSADELQQLADAVVSGGLLPEGVVFLLWCFDAASASKHRGMAAAVMGQFEVANSRTRRQIAELYSDLFPHALDPVVSATRHEEQEVRREAALLLNRMDSSVALKPLLSVLHNDDGRPNYRVVRALGQLGDPAAVEPLLRLVTDAAGRPDPDVAIALGDIGDPRAVDPLLRLLTDADATRHNAVIAALGRLRDPRAVEPLLKVLAQADGPQRAHVVEILGSLGDARAVEPLLACLTHPDGAPHLNAVEALGLLGDRRAVDPLLALLEDTEGDARLRVAVALGRLGDRRALHVLLDEQKGRPLEPGSETTAALAVLGDAEATRVLENAMREATGEQRRAALWSLALLEKDPLNRILLSRDRDGLAPGIDPRTEIKETALRPYGAVTSLPLHEVRSRYEELAERYPLRLSWHRRQATRPESTPSRPGSP
ncbi:HEAT repeat domain-containing protein [Streptomyces sp. H51]|uniref:HEAT repeat domain-containing protein n=1 Tax=Streptomyces sp. H51 TaxID=3111770 RepID=UPI002D7966A3|nr:HEAT repeat domain-containing protein [Streptomyces sp. H51]